MSSVNDKYEVIDVPQGFVTPKPIELNILKCSHCGEAVTRANKNLAQVSCFDCKKARHQKATTINNKKLRS